MAKRFTDTNKWKDTWFEGLPSKYKLFWIYILDDCDHAGIWKVNFRLAQFLIGDPLEISEVKRILKERIEVLNDEYWWVPKFLKFQYPKGLKETSSAQRGVIQILENHSLIERVTKEFRKGYITLQDKDKDKDKDKEGVPIPKITGISQLPMYPFAEKYLKEQGQSFYMVKTTLLPNVSMTSFADLLVAYLGECAESNKVHTEYSDFETHVANWVKYENFNLEKKLNYADKIIKNIGT